MKSINIKRFLPVMVVGMVILLAISGCSNYEDVTACVDGKIYGFWNGLWHGIIAPVDLVAMIWRDDVTVFAPNNNGTWYAFGFVLGSGGWGFLGGKGSGRASKKKRD